jgi:hypothetical protein
MNEAKIDAYVNLVKACAEILENSMPAAGHKDCSVVADYHLHAMAKAMFALRDSLYPNEYSVTKEK